LESSILIQNFIPAETLTIHTVQIEILLVRLARGRRYNATQLRGDSHLGESNPLVKLIYREAHSNKTGVARTAHDAAYRMVGTSMAGALGALLGQKSNPGDL